MARGKKHTPEQIVGLLREIEVAVANRKTTLLGMYRARFRKSRKLILRDPSFCCVIYFDNCAILCFNCAIARN
jgi:hypothetical protein